VSFSCLWYHDNHVDDFLVADFFGVFGVSTLPAFVVGALVSPVRDVFAIIKEIKK
jgi:hypothetical protein